jgi:hypothetical protein
MINKLIKIQQELKSPKNQRNNFGNYNYRSCEDILEAVKPLLHKEGLLLTIHDEIVKLGDRYYVKAVAKITDGEKEIKEMALAREEESKKGMDGSQITGASSSYARKYALNGLFLIDDTKDSDTTNTGEIKPKLIPKRSEVKANTPNYFCEDCGKIIPEVVKNYSVSKFGRQLCRPCQDKEKENQDSLNKVIEDIK